MLQTPHAILVLFDVFEVGSHGQTKFLAIHQERSKWSKKKRIFHFLFLSGRRRLISAQLDDWNLSDQAARLLGTAMRRVVEAAIICRRHPRRTVNKQTPALAHLDIGREPVPQNTEHR